MSDDDLIRRGDAIEALRGVGILPEDAALDALRAIPAVAAPGDLVPRAAVTALIDESERIDDAEARLRHVANGVLMLPAAPPAPCGTPDCIDGYVPRQPDGEPQPCPSCRGGA